MTPYQVDPDIARVVLPAGAPEDVWLAERLKGIGGSDIAQAAGIAKYGSPFQLWMVKTGRIDPEDLLTDEDRERFYWGHALEPVVVARFAKNHPEYDVTPGAGTYARVEAEWQRVNVDSLAWNPDGSLAAVIEAKTGNHRVLADWNGEEIPLSYYYQCQWAMWITGAPLTFICALIDTHNYIEKVIERDDEMIADLVDFGAEFWRQVVDDVMPEVDGHDDTSSMLATTHYEPGSMVELDLGWLKDLTLRGELVQQIKDLTEKKTQIDNRMRVAIGDAETAWVGDDKVATFKASSKPTRKVDPELLDILGEDFPEVYAAVVTEKPASRRLTYANHTTTPERNHE
ncbi:YqaJ viral recombinase family protein [Amycolatopsis sp. DSM 110486]|uniref:YqaJ viral recombinase family nuclease n=1 Tax=Amycolatopsis sp. DSM 110486 TaxID=2865832 RepID=UPI001C69905A|nr:YqaJ viral recombinase family protein [Amycolatopsis sp. DSM 110486]QYN17444.1 YqaJ viral recombinase family protein [Amycolatopsis sp. DSM 110486]